MNFISSKAILGILPDEQHQNARGACFVDLLDYEITCVQRNNFLSTKFTKNDNFEVKKKKIYTHRLFHSPINSQNMRPGRFDAVRKLEIQK